MVLLLDTLTISEMPNVDLTTWLETIATHSINSCKGADNGMSFLNQSFGISTRKHCKTWWEEKNK